MPTKFNTLASRTVLETPIFDVRMDTVHNPRSDFKSDFVVLDSPDWVNVVAVTTENEVVMIRQYRHGTASIDLEIPGGIVDPGEDIQKAALRELQEETGYRADHVVKLCMVAPNPVILNNMCHTYLATGCRKTAETSLDEMEDIEVVLMSREVVLAAIESGEIHHAVMLCALYHWLFLNKTA